MNDIDKQIDLITELTLKLKEKQGTERKEVHALIDKTIRALVSEARIQDEKIANEVIDQFSIHQPKGQAKGTVARRIMKSRLHKRLKALKQTLPTPNGDEQGGLL